MNTWSHRAGLFLDCMADPSRWLCPPGQANGDPAEDLRRLLDIRGRLGVNDGQTDAAGFTAQRLAEQWAGQHRRHDLVDLLRQTINAIDARIAGLEADDPRIVKTKDFAQVRPLGVSSLGQPATLWMGLVHTLPPTHRLRTILPPEDFYQADGLTGNNNNPALVLGLGEPVVVGDGPARKFYLLADVLNHTRLFRQRQIEKAEQLAREEAEEGKRRQREFWASPLGEMELKRRVLEELRQRGQIPDVKPEPAVRRGSW